MAKPKLTNVSPTLVGRSIGSTTTGKDPKKGRPGYVPCPRCGRYVVLNSDRTARRHNQLGINRIPCF